MTNEYRKIEVYNKYNKFINLSFKRTHELLLSLSLTLILCRI